MLVFMKARNFINFKILSKKQNPKSDYNLNKFEENIS